MLFLSFLVLKTNCATETSPEERSFLQWMRATQNFYVGDEYHFRFGVWLTNYKYIHAKKQANTHFKSGMNSFSALMPTEYRSSLGYKNNRQKPPKKINQKNNIFKGQTVYFHRISTIESTIK